MRITKIVKSVKYSLGAINCLFLIKGLLFLIIGVTVLVRFKAYESLITDRFLALPALVIATAVIIFLIGALGFYSAISQEFYFIAGYFLCLLVILIFEIAICIIGYGLYNNASVAIRTTMLASLQEYENRIDVARVWDDLQSQFECCGVMGRNDWGTNNIPISCCHINYGIISPFECTTANAYTAGCSGALGEWLSHNSYMLGVTSVVFIVFQVLIISATGWLAWRTKFEEVELES